MVAALMDSLEEMPTGIPDSSRGRQRDLLRSVLSGRRLSGRNILSARVLIHSMYISCISSSVASSSKRQSLFITLCSCLHLPIGAHDALDSVSIIPTSHPD